MCRPLDQESPNVEEFLAPSKLDLAINIPKNLQEDGLMNDYLIRRRAIDFGVPFTANVQLTRRSAEVILRNRLSDCEIMSWGE